MGINSVLGSTPMDPDSKPKGPKDKRGGTCQQSVAGGKLLEAMGARGTRAFYSTKAGTSTRRGAAVVGTS
jgi:hypothetical protein